MYHLELRQFPHVARVFNLDREQLDTRFVAPWVAGTIIEHDDRRWTPERCRLKILEGPELRPDELGMGRGWATATKGSTDVTEQLLAQARRGAGARPELEALKAAILEVGELGFGDAVALAAAGHPDWRASESLALAEQAVWELLHLGQLELAEGGATVPAERWQAVVLSWDTWAEAGEFELRALDPEA